LLLQLALLLSVELARAVVVVEVFGVVVGFVVLEGVELLGSYCVVVVCVELFVR